MIKISKEVYTTMELKNVKTCIFGRQGSGKTYWARKQLKEFKAPIIFLINDDDEWEKERVYIWKAEINKLDQNSLQDQFSKFIEYARNKVMKGLIDLIIIDEADLFVRNNFDPDPNHFDLILNHRHRGKGLALWYLTRRPQDIPAVIVESSEYLVFFKLRGDNAYKKCKEFDESLPEQIKKLTKDKHDYLIMDGEDKITHYDAVK